MSNHHPKTLPAALVQAVKAAAPASARRRTWRINIRETVTLPYCYWDGGSKAEYDGATLSGARLTLPCGHTTQGHFSHPSTWVEPVHNIRDGEVIVRHGISCGKTAYPSVMINAATAALLGVTE